ncbi:MAG: hypothetical protein ABJE95_36780 [Byssovorax sp.]
MISGLLSLGRLLWGLLRRLLWREDLQFIVHCLFLLWMMSFLRAMFSAVTPTASYEAASIAWSLVVKDNALLLRAIHDRRFPSLQSLQTLRQLLVVFLVIPTVVLLAARRKLRWTDWEAGKSLRVMVMVMLVTLAWSGSTFEYNIYLDRGHALDRLLLVALTLMSWRTPLAVPFATRWSIVMLKEAYVPIPLDDFDFRSVPEVLIVFSCFTWASLHKSFKTRHFLLVGLGAWASYYYAAGMAKINYGPSWSWFLENHISNISANAHVRGWLSFLSDSTFSKGVAFIRRFDLALAGYTLLIELGALVVFVHPRVVRTWVLLCALLHFGIFAFTGIFFWKWMVTNLAFYFFLRYGGSTIVKQMCRPRLVVLFAIAMVYNSRGRGYFYPQTGVAWYDSKFMENYVLYAIGKSGHKYLIRPGYLAPMDTHWTQGRLCYATNERSITGIYGSTGNFPLLQKLEALSTPEEALKLLSTGGVCTNVKRRAIFDEFFTRYFGNLNHHDRGLQWVSWIGAPRHLWVFPKGDLYDRQEPVEKIELWRDLVVNQGEQLHHLEMKLVHTVPIPP